MKILIFLCCSALAAAAQACSCARAGSPEEAFAKADAVFSVEVMEGRWEGRTFVATVRVDKAWKGVAVGTAAVETGSFVSACGVMLEKGGAYLVYAFKAGPRWGTNVCMGTKRLYRAGASGGKGMDAVARKRFKERLPAALAAQAKELEALDKIAGAKSKEPKPDKAKPE